ncbi:MAG TPA: fumarate hydratase C-terminal domain-containing protein, partial [Tissierellaceae bacterium]|nr:fumarate hydratase C-terminal domain-containing protein [Tissierellaceae bacterium]
DQEVVDSIVKNDAIYFAAIGGAAALIAKSVKSAEIVAYEDLGAEAIRKLYVEDFPVTVINDTHGNDLYKMGREEYLEWAK